MDLIDQFRNPSREFTLIPLWFWNDELREAELARQIADFEAHGVYGFGIHIRIGVPHDFGWMSDRMMALVRFALAEARRREMSVVFFDEGMYPSGSSCGQVVAANPAHRARCLFQVPTADDGALDLAADENLVARVQRRDGRRIVVLDRPSAAVIRGIHYVAEGPEEQRPPAGDILNPAAVQSFSHCVCDRLHTCVGEYFGDTLIGIFTDEPSFLAKAPNPIPDVEARLNERPGTTGILDHVSAILEYDFTPNLPALWYDDEPDADRHRNAYMRALRRRLDETYYRPLHDWCEDHGIALMGHPAEPDDLATERFFHIPGQDVIARKILSGAASLEGPESTQAKCASSAMTHLGRRRNSSECFGDYGHELTYAETKFITDLLLVRGTNMLMPHAFYYSMRGCRRDERPPDVGPNSAWWDDYRGYADYCRRMCWLNADSQHVCDIAILGHADGLPWTAARVCFEHQRDFNYVLPGDLEQPRAVTTDGLCVGEMVYRALIIDGEGPASKSGALDLLAENNRLIQWRSPAGLAGIAGAVCVTTESEMMDALDAVAPADVVVTPPTPDLRVRHVVKNGAHVYLFCNEGCASLAASVNVAVAGDRTWVDPMNCETQPVSDGAQIKLEPGAPLLLCVNA